MPSCSSVLNIVEVLCFSKSSIFSILKGRGETDILVGELSSGGPELESSRRCLEISSWFMLNNIIKILIADKIKSH